MSQKSNSFMIEYPLGIEDQRLKGMMFLFAKMMLNGFADYGLIEKVQITWDRVYIFVDTHVKEFYKEGSELMYLTSHEKVNFNVFK